MVINLAAVIWISGREVEALGFWVGLGEPGNINMFPVSFI